MERGIKCASNTGPKPAHACASHSPNFIAKAGISLFTSRDILRFVLGDKGIGAHCHALDSLDSIHVIQVHISIVLMEVLSFIGQSESIKPLWLPYSSPQHPV